MANPQKKLFDPSGGRLTTWRAPGGRPARLRKVGKGRGPGTARVWLEGKFLERGGFSVGKSINVKIDPGMKRLTIKLDPSGGRIVSKHRGKPVIDVLSKALKKAMGAAEEVVIEFGTGEIGIHPRPGMWIPLDRVKRWNVANVPRRIEERIRMANGTVGSVFTGAGFMDLAAELAGYVSVFGVELAWKYARMFLANRSAAHTVHLPLQEALGLQWKYGRQRERMAPWAELLVAGIPCQPWSIYQRQKGMEPEEHHLWGLTYYFLSFVLEFNPLNLVIEQVPEYVEDDLYKLILKPFLEEMGYHVTHKFVDSHELGYLAKRPRVYIVATTKKGFSWKKALKKTKGQLARSILLDPHSPLITRSRDTQGGWFTHGARSGPGEYMEGLWDRGVFKPSYVSPESKKIGTIVRDYYKPAPTGPFVRHPTKKDTYRLLTVEEIRRLHGVPDWYELPGAVGTQAAALGQSVIVPLVTQIIKALPGGKPFIEAEFRRTRNNPMIVPIWYGPGPMYSVIPWGRIW